MRKRNSDWQSDHISDPEVSISDQEAHRLRHQDEPPLGFASGDLVVGGRSLREGDDTIDHRSLERAFLEEGSERLEQSRGSDRVAMARVNPEQPALVVLEGRD
jgi:hypothetical protein